MKSLIYKEFATVKKLSIFLCFYYVIGGILAGFGGSLTISYLGYLLTASVLVRIFADDDKSGWDKYSRALPFTAYQRVGAKYLFWSAVFFAMILLTVVSCAAAGLASDTYNGDLGKIATEWIPLYIPLYAFWWSMGLISSAFAMLIGYIVKGTAKSLLVSAAFVPSYLAYFVLAFSGTILKSTKLIASVCKPKFTVMIAISSLLFFAASYFISVIVETKSGREKLKAVKAVAIMLTVVAVSLSGITVYALEKDGAFEKPESNTFEGNSFVEVLEEDKERDAVARKDMMKITEHICGKIYTGIRTEDLYAEFEQLGYGDYIVEFKDFYHSEKIVSVSPVIYGTSAYTGESGYTDGFQVKADVLPNSVSVSANRLVALFPDGMSEEDALAKMKEYNLCPQRIREVIVEEKLCRTYTFSVDFSDFGNDGSMSFDIVDGAVCNKWNSFGIE